MTTVLNYVIGGDDASKYPFLPEVGDQMVGWDISELLKSELPILEGAKDRIIYGLKYGTSPELNNGVEERTIAKFSFPIALLLVKATNQNHLISRFALAESRKILMLFHIFLKHFLKFSLQKQILLTVNQNLLSYVQISNINWN